MRTNLAKVLGVSLLAIVGILAVNASAAQATWTLLKNGSPAPNNLLNVIEKDLPVEFLLLGLFEVNCLGALGTNHYEGGAFLKSNENVHFQGCKILKFPKCEVRSSESTVGTIVVEGKGEGSLSGTSVQNLVKSSNLTEVIVENELCPFNETEAVVSGSLTSLILNAATSSVEHSAHLDDDEMFFGEWETLIDGSGGANTAQLHITEVSGATWAIDHS